MCEIIKFYTIKCVNCLYKIPSTRLELIKKISKKLQQENIVYVKIFQALCFDRDLLSIEEQDYLLKYTDNVPYNHNEIDHDLLHKLEAEFSITLTSIIPINCGIVGLVFDGYDSSNNKVIIKMLKNNILEHKIANEDDFKSIENKIKAQINDVVEFAKNSPEPAESELLTEIYH
jgi:predicted unusual protein kinase regulating ubiquinone biosynthesis (AarF/ABC1/UbiB family)